MAQIRLESWGDAELYELRKTNPNLANRIEREAKAHDKRVRKYRPHSNRKVGQYK